MIRLLISVIGLRTLAVALAGCCLVLPLRAQTPAPPPRVAIVPGSEDKELGTLADLLIVSMARASQRYQMVERADLKRLGQEAEVQRMNIAERPRALARLVKADGLILLTLDQAYPLRRSISARLSSTASGLIQATVTLPAGDKDLPMAAKLAAEALQYSAERLSTAGNTPKHIVSLLGIRAAVDLAPSVALETTLNAALTHHLGRIPGFAVVERWKLDDVAFERSLSEKDMPSLATGTTLVDGSFELKAGATVVKVRVRTSQKDAGKTLVVEGPSENVFALAESIASKVAAECGSHAAPAPWDARAEAAAYAKLGDWLISQRLGIEAVQAYESSVALGDRSAETLAKRIEAYALVSSPIIGFDTDSYRFSGSALAQHLERRKEHVAAVVISTSRAAAYCAEFAAADWPPVTGRNVRTPLGRAEDTAVMACRVLIAAHKLKLHMERPGDVEALRQRTESLARLVEKRNGPFVGFDLALSAGYWAATPGQAAERWREFLAPDLPPAELSYRRRMVAGHPIRFSHEGGPFILDWTTPDNALGSAAWERLLGELGASKALINQADAIALGICAAHWTQRGKLQTQYIEFMERKRAALATSQGQALFYAYDPIASYPTVYGTWERYASLCTSAFADSAVVDYWAADAMLLHITRFHQDGSIPQSKASQDAAAKLLKAIMDYSNRARAVGTTTSSSYQSRRFGPDEIAQLLKGIFRDLADVPSAERPADGVPVRYLHLRLPGDQSDADAWVEWYLMGQIENRLIVQRVKRDGYLSIRDDLTMELIPPLPERENQATTVKLFPAKDGFLFLTWEHGMWHYSDHERNWSEVPGIPHQKQQIVGMVGDTFYLSQSSDGGRTIGRVKAGRYELISSSRRRPEEHPLDALSSGAGDFFPGANGRPYVILGRADAKGLPACELYDLELKKGLVLLNSCSRAIRDGSRTFLWDGCLLAVVDANSEMPKVLIRRPKGIPFTTDELPSEAVWEWPSGGPDYVYLGGPHTGYHPLMRDERLFVLKDVDRLSMTSPYGADELSLLCFRPGARNAVEIPLDYHPTEAMQSYTGSGKPVLVRPDIRGAVWTSTGIFFAPLRSPGLLYVTWADVNRWLAKHGDEARNSATGAGAAPPKQASDARPAKP